MARGRRDPQAESFWRWVIHEQSESGLTVKDFCTREGMSTASFYTWRRRLQGNTDGPVRKSEVSRSVKSSAPGPDSSLEKKRAARTKAAAASGPATPTLLPLEVIDGLNPAIEIVHPRGHVVRIPAGLFGDPLQHVLKLLDAHVNASD